MGSAGPSLKKFFSGHRGMMAPARARTGTSKIVAWTVVQPAKVIEPLIEMRHVALEAAAALAASTRVEFFTMTRGE